MTKILTEEELRQEQPQIFEFLDLKPKWQNGVLGLMQLITLSHINQALTRRFI